jgi:hypothetical protein
MIYNFLNPKLNNPTRGNYSGGYTPTDFEIKTTKVVKKI